MASTSGSFRRASYDPYAFGIPSAAAALRALSALREAMAVTSEYRPRCMAGMTFSVAIFATPSTPHLTLVIASGSLASGFSWNRVRLKADTTDVA